MRNQITQLLVALAVTAACSTGRSPVPETVTSTVATLRVVSYNIRHGRGSDDKLDLGRTASVLRSLSPDIVGLQEVDEGVERSGDVDEAAFLGEALGMHHAFGAFMEYQGGRYGMGILSRYPIQRVTPYELPEGNEPRVALMVEVDVPVVGRVAVVNVHFDWVSSDSFRLAQASAVTGLLDTLSLPYILLGDFNDIPESRTLALFKERADEAMKPDAGRLTFSATDPRREIDFIFSAPKGRWEARGVRVVDERVASDHRPVFAELVWRRE